MDLQEIGLTAGNWVDSPQDRDYLRALVNEALNLRFSIVIYVKMLLLQEI